MFKDRFKDIKEHWLFNSIQYVIMLTISMILRTNFWEHY